MKARFLPLFLTTLFIGCSIKAMQNSRQSFEEEEEIVPQTMLHTPDLKGKEKAAAPDIRTETPEVNTDNSTFLTAASLAQAMKDSSGKNQAGPSTLTTENPEDGILNQISFTGDRKKISDELCTELLNCAPKGINDIVNNISFPEIAGDGTPSGILFVGPPGTGKTNLAKAMAQQSGRGFLPIITGALVDQFQGSGEQNITAVVDFISSLNKPYIILLDETQSVSEGSENKKNSNFGVAVLIWQLMDKHKKEPNLFFVGTTNDEEQIPAPLKRRINIFTIPLPDAKTRQQIISFYFKKYPYKNAEIGKTCDQSCIDWLVGKTKNFAGRDIENLITTAIGKAFSQRVKNGEIKRNSDGSILNSTSKTVVERKDLEAALPEARASVDGKTDWKWWREKSAWAWREVILPITLFGANAGLQIYLQNRQLEVQRESMAMQATGLTSQEASLELARSSFKHQRINAILPYYNKTWAWYPNRRCAQMLEHFENSDIPADQRITKNPALQFKNTKWVKGKLELDGVDESRNPDDYTPNCGWF